MFRELGDLEPNRDPVRLRRFLQAYALNTAGVTPLRTLVEPALLGPLSGMDPKGIVGTPDLLGRLLETDVIAQLRPEAALGDATLCHLRDEGGRREVDLIAEFGDGRVIAIEVKSTSTPSVRAARHLIGLRDALGERFIAGLVLHTGRGVTRLDDRIAAAPISALWA